jgi:hypothetical protein
VLFVLFIAAHQPFLVMGVIFLGCSHRRANRLPSMVYFVFVVFLPILMFLEAGF